MFPVSHLNLHDTPKIWCRRRGQSGSPIGCEGLYFHAMYKNRVLVSGWSSISCEGFHTNLNIPSLLPTTLVFRWFCRLLMSSLSQSILTNLRWKPQIAMYVQVRTIILQTHFLASIPRFGGQVSPVSLLLLCELALQPAFHLLVSHGSCEIKKKTQQMTASSGEPPGSFCGSGNVVSKIPSWRPIQLSWSTASHGAKMIRSLQNGSVCTYLQATLVVSGGLPGMVRSDSFGPQIEDVD